MKKYYPNVIQLLYLLILWIVSFIFFLSIFVLIFSLLKMDLKKDFWFVNISYAFAFIVIIFFIKKQKPGKIRDIFILYKFNPFYLLPISFTTIGLIIIAPELSRILICFSPLPTKTFIPIVYNNIKIFSLIISIITAVLITPLSEEIIFRSVLLPSFINKYNTKIGIIFTSILFSIIHINPSQIIYTFILSIFLCLWTIKLKSIIPSIFSHVLFNFIPFISLNYFNITRETSSITKILSISIGGILIIIGIISFNYTLKKIINNKKNI